MSAPPSSKPDPVIFVDRQMCTTTKQRKERKKRQISLRTLGKRVHREVEKKTSRRRRQDEDVVRCMRPVDVSKPHMPECSHQTFGLCGWCVNRWLSTIRYLRPTARIMSGHHIADIVYDEGDLIIVAHSICNIHVSNGAIYCLASKVCTIFAKNGINVQLNCDTSITASDIYTAGSISINFCHLRFPLF
jgi:hypothetical protein